MRIPPEEHTARPWRIHEITRDFELEDVWALPTPGARNDFGLLITSVRRGGPEDGASPIGRFIWAVRWRLGQWFGWDRDDGGLGSRVTSLRERLPHDLLDRPIPPADNSPFTPIFQTENEYAAEIANNTMHGVLHLGWVEDSPGGSGGYHAQMAVLVKPQGRLGRIYMAGIKPFRYLVIYPPLIRNIEREWRTVQQSGETA